MAERRQFIPDQYVEASGPKISATTEDTYGRIDTDSSGRATGGSMEVGVPIYLGAAAMTR